VGVGGVGPGGFPIGGPQREQEYQGQAQGQPGLAAQLTPTQGAVQVGIKSEPSKAAN
jgi:hypothetical protein